MSKEMGVILLGFVVVITPFLGVPSSWKTALFVGGGLGVMLLGFLLRGEVLSRSMQGTASRDGHPFVENHADEPRA